MSYIAVTYGYNMFSIFNLNSSTQPLIDNIIVNCFEDLMINLAKRLEQLTKEIESFNTEETNLKKQLIKKEEEKLKEEEKIEEQKKIEEEKRKEDKDKKKANIAPVKSLILF